MARVLVVDDDPDIRVLLMALVAEAGHKVASAPDGKSALEIIEHEAPDVVLLDVMMPRMDGYEVVHEMKTRGLRDQTKVLFLTAKASEGDWVRGYRSGADDYLTKPFDTDELLAKIEMLLSTTREKLSQRRQDELDRAQLLSRLEAFFDTAPHRPGN